MQYIVVRSAGKDALALKSIVIYGLKYYASSASDAILLPVYEPSWFSAFFQSFFKEVDGEIETPFSIMLLCNP